MRRDTAPKSVYLASPSANREETARILVQEGLCHLSPLLQDEDGERPDTTDLCHEEGTQTVFWLGLQKNLQNFDLFAAIHRRMKEASIPYTLRTVCYDHRPDGTGTPPWHPQTLWAERDSEGGFPTIEPHPSLLRMHGIDDADMAPIRARNARPDEEETHWGWFETDTGELVMIYPNEMLLTLCFPYGPAIEEEHGKGLRTRLVVEPAPH